MLLLSAQIQESVNTAQGNDSATPVRSPRCGVMSWRAVVLLLLLTACDCSAAKIEVPYTLPPEFDMSTSDLIRHWGYKAEAYNVTTEDGYILALHRMLPGNRTRPATPVILLNGLGACSEYWLSQRNTMPSILADEGFDVWIGDFRGSPYGMSHKYLSYNDSKFWDFSWHHNGVWDAAAHVDHVLRVAGRRPVLVGHSMGATAALALLADRPQYNVRLRAAFLLAPPVFMQHMRGFVKEWLGAFVVMYPMMIRSAPFSMPFPRGDHPKRSCFPEDFDKMLPLCANFISYLFGPGVTSQTVKHWLLGHYPTGASWKQFGHYLQLLVKGGFWKFDYGTRGNLLKYGQPTAPPYNLKNVVLPVFIHYMDLDYLASVEDVTRLSSNLPGSRGMYLFPGKGFNHIDMLMSTEKMLFTELLSQLKMFD